MTEQVKPEQKEVKTEQVKQPEQKEVKSEQKEVKSEQKKYVCSECGKEFKTYHAWYQHMHRKHQPNKLVVKGSRIKKVKKPELIKKEDNNNKLLIVMAVIGVTLGFLLIYSIFKKVNKNEPSRRS